MAPDGHFWSTERSDLQHTRVDSSQKKLPQLPSLALILGKGRVKHLEEHIAGQKESALGLNASFVRDWDVSKHRLARPGKTGSWAGALDFFLEVPTTPFEMQKNLLCFRCSGGFFFSPPHLPGAKGCVRMKGRSGRG